MTLDDICDAPFTERVRHELRQLYGKDARTMNAEELAHCQQVVTSDMLNEIHFMLRVLTGVTPRD